MNVEFTSYPIQDWVLDENTMQLSDPTFGLDAIKQTVKFILSTERNMYPIMGSNFGVEFLDLISKDEQYVRAQLKRRITDALSVDDRIINVTNFEFSYDENNSLFTSFVVETVLGNVNMTTTVVS